MGEKITQRETAWSGISLRSGKYRQDSSKELAKTDERIMLK
jgi:head-tail adaptor